MDMLRLMRNRRGLNRPLHETKQHRLYHRSKGTTMIKTAHQGYITIKRYDLYETKAIPTGKVREVDGEKEAEFLLLDSKRTERKVWLKRAEIY